MRRTLALWLLLSGAFAATLGLDRLARERRYLHAAEDLIERGDVGDAGVGFPLLIAPAQALAGPEGVELRWPRRHGSTSTRASATARW